MVEVWAEPILTHPPDEGCNVSPSCLRCPLDACKYDDIRFYQRWVQAQKEQNILGLLKDGFTIRSVADQCGISLRTIRRATQRAREGALL